jgi:hypothetical protein
MMASTYLMENREFILHYMELMNFMNNYIKSRFSKILKITIRISKGECLDSVRVAQAAA